MTKKKKAYKIDVDLSDIFSNSPTQSNRRTPERHHSLDIPQALDLVVRQMKAAGLRERTISDYEMHVSHFANIVGEEITLADLNVEHIYEWLASMDVSNSTKLIRLKCLKAFLSRCFHNGWLERNFWNEVKIKVDTPVKEGATDREIRVLLSLLDLSDFVQLRDATALLTMYQTGLRVGTVVQLENRHVDLDGQILKIDGGLLKNHAAIHLPFDEDLKRLYAVLMRQNDIIRRENNVMNSYLFITRNGGKIATSPTNNNIQKRLNKYARMYGLKNINPHALRRGFAKNLLKKGADLPLISKALGHSDLAVTSRYLHLDQQEVADNLRKFL